MDVALGIAGAPADADVIAAAHPWGEDELGEDFPSVLGRQMDFACDDGEPHNPIGDFSI